jgi:hypothetical protein
MTKINFFTPASLGKLKNAIDLYTSESFTPAASALFGELVAIDFSADCDRVFLHDDLGHSLSPSYDHLDLWVDTEAGDGCLYDVLNEAIVLHNASEISELWEQYSMYIDLDTKTRIFNKFHFITSVVATTYTGSEHWQDYMFFACTFAGLGVCEFVNTHFVRCYFKGDISGVTFTNCVFDTVEFGTECQAGGCDFGSVMLVNTSLPC